jgi:hypothetical protein
MDLRNNQDDRPYRPARPDYGASPRQNEWEEGTLSTQGYYREVLRNLTEQRWFPLAAVTMGVVVFGSLIAFAYRQGAQTNPNMTTPLIQAENQSYKERPQDPGGMDVPFQDAIVFDQLDKTKMSDASEKVESLLPPPEQPIADPVKEVADASQASTETAPPSAPREDAEDKSVIAQNDVKSDEGNSADSIADKIAATEAAMKNKTTETVTKIDNKVEEQVAAVEKKVEQKVTSVAQTTSQTVQQATTQTTAQATKTIPAKASSLNNVAPAAPTPVANNVASTGNAKVQLGAFKDEAAARAAWAQFQKQYAPHLNGVTPNYARADLGAKGVFYRVQGVNLSQAKAKTICQSINSIKSGSCLIPQ